MLSSVIPHRWLEVHTGEASRKHLSQPTQSTDYGNLSLPPTMWVVKTRTQAEAGNPAIPLIKTSPPLHVILHLLYNMKTQLGMESCMLPITRFQAFT